MGDDVGEATWSKSEGVGEALSIFWGVIWHEPGEGIAARSANAGARGELAGEGIWGGNDWVRCLEGVRSLLCMDRSKDLFEGV
jgi:hypothetical protein